MTNLAKSLATLVKYNQGFFKSEKQAAYLLAATQGVLVVSNSFSLGDEYNNKRAGIGSKTVYSLDDKGVVSVEKHNSKGTTTVFDRNCPKSLEANKAHLEAITASNEKAALFTLAYNRQALANAFITRLMVDKAKLKLTAIGESTIDFQDIFNQYENGKKLIDVNDFRSKPDYSKIIAVYDQTTLDIKKYG